MQQIGRYQIIGELGRGAMGIVYRALDPSIGRTVAIKTIRLSELADPGEGSKLRDRLFLEAQSAGILSHPGIVTIYDVAEQGDLAYIAMEFVDGPTLDKLYHSGPLEKKLILDALNQTASALDYAHKRGIVHRDIKPSNIMIHEMSSAKITDFGVAKIQSQQKTLAGHMMGTPNYMSPEQIQGPTIDGRADQFSLAVIAYELLTGEKPFTGDSLPTLLFKIVKEDPLPPQRLNSSLGWPVGTVLQRALAKKADDRYSTCTEFITALENACKSSKDWKPVPPGSSLMLPTVMEAPVPIIAAPPPAPSPESRKTLPTAYDRIRLDEEESEKPSRALRVARAAAVAVLILGLVSALVLGSMEYFSEPVAAPQAEVIDKTAEPYVVNPKPSPLGERVTPPEPPGKESQRTAETQPETGEEAAGQQPASSPASAQVMARIVTSPPGATVVFDSSPEMACTTPCGMNLSSGRHTLAATMDGHRRALRIFELPQDSVVFINMEPTEGTVMVRSDPAGASIYVNGQLRKETTPAMLRLPTGRYTIEIVKEGLKKDVAQVDVKDSVITNLDVNWNLNR